MSPETIIVALVVALVTFLLGWLTASLVFMAKFGDRLTRVETQLDDLIDRVEKIRVDVPPCQFHIDLDKRVVKTEGHIESLLQAKLLRDSK